MKRKTSKQLALAAIAAALIFSACKNSPYPGYEMSENGLYSKFYKQDEKGVKPKEGDMIKVIMSYKNSKDSVLFDSKKNPNGTNFIEFPLQKSSFKGSFEDALMSMSVGDSASFIISADSLYTKTFKANELPKYIEKGSMLTFEAKLEKVTSKEEVEKERAKKMEEQKVMMELRKSQEANTIAKYIADNKITAKPTASGLYYIEKTKGKGPKPVIGDTVIVNYVGRLLDGSIFDTNIGSEAKKSGNYDEKRPYDVPVPFPLIPVGGLIEGWKEGLVMMNQGGKAQMIIPSALGWGERGVGQMIPPYSPVEFEVELINIKHPKK